MQDVLKTNFREITGGVPRGVLESFHENISLERFLKEFVKESLKKFPKGFLGDSLKNLQTFCFKELKEGFFLRNSCFHPTRNK